MISKSKKSTIDHSGKTTTPEKALLQMLGIALPKKKKAKKKKAKKKSLKKLAGPWRHDFRNNCDVNSSSAQRCSVTHDSSGRSLYQKARLYGLLSVGAVAGTD